MTEAFLRISAQDKYYVYAPGTNLLFEASAVMPGVTGQSSFTINSQGIRGDELTSSDYRILAVGGSSTECLYLDDSEAWPRLLQDKLNATQTKRVWVGNVGGSGQNSRDHILVAQEYLERLPQQHLILFKVGVNDLLLHLGKRGAAQTFDPFKDSYELMFTGKAFSTHRPKLKPSYWFDPINIRHLLMMTGRWWQDPQNPYQLDQRVGSVTHYSYFRSLRQQNSVQFIDSLPNLSKQLSEFQKNLLNMTEVSRAHDANPVFITQPTMWQKDMDPANEKLLWLGYVDDHSAYYSSGALERGMALYNEALLEHCRHTNSICIDLAAMLPKDTSVFYDGVHFNEHGAEQVANYIHSHLVRLHLVPLTH